MVSPKELTIRQSRKMKNFVEPLEYEGVKCMSFGFVNQKAAPGAGGWLPTMLSYRDSVWKYVRMIMLWSLSIVQAWARP